MHVIRHIRNPGSKDSALNLRPGEIVKVLSEDEILATLDENGTLEGLPFMFEMRKYCRRAFRVLTRIDKIVIEDNGTRRIKNAVLLKGAICDGEAHRGCDRTCPIIWKESWLKQDQSSLRSQTARKVPAINCSADSEDETLSCQATQLVKATSPLPFWDIRQCFWDIQSGTLDPLKILQMSLLSLNSPFQKSLLRRKGNPIRGKCKQTPTIDLGLQPWELVEVRSKEEILAL